MRRKGINANPPICRSKDANTCMITFRDCTTNDTIATGIWRNITREECIAHEHDNDPSHGTRYFSAPILHFEEIVEFDNCAYPPHPQNIGGG